MQLKTTYATHLPVLHTHKNGAIGLHDEWRVDYNQAQEGAQMCDEWLRRTENQQTYSQEPRQYLTVSTTELRNWVARGWWQSTGRPGHQTGLHGGDHSSDWGVPSHCVVLPHVVSSGQDKQLHLAPLHPTLTGEKANFSTSASTAGGSAEPGRAFTQRLSDMPTSRVEL